jgi:tRNA-specific 2-thiouridylase
MDLQRKKVAVGLSGGVDSSVAAALLLEEGYDVTGLMLRLWVDEEAGEENRCCSLDSIDLARTVARKLGIPFFVIDARQEFRNRVVEYFLESYKKGETPNPCVVCNKWMRWGFLRKKAEMMGLEYLATGHYARVEKIGSEFSLKKGLDPTKDQSYVLSRLSQDDLAKTILPLGGWMKIETRKKAESLGLLVSQKPDSQDLCFTQMGVTGFLKKYAPELIVEGEIVDLEGNIIGSHQGVAGFTIGQRKGIKIAASHPLYVVEKNIEKNQLVVARSGAVDHTEFRIRDINWLHHPAGDEIDGDVMVRYRSSSFPARIVIIDEEKTAAIISNGSIRNITPGQLAVIYQGEDVLGSGFITNEVKG